MRQRETTLQKNLYAPTNLEHKMLNPSPFAIIEENPDHFVAVSALFNRIFCKDFSPQVFFWKYRMEEYGRIFAVCTWDFERLELVGHVAAIPLSGWKDGRETIFFQFVDAMVHERARGRNLLTKMIYKLLENIKGSYDNFIPYVFPGPVSGAIGQKYGWLHRVTEIKDFRPLGASRLSLFRTFAVRFVKGEPEKKRCNDLWERTGKDFPCAVKRDWKFISWRYLKNPVENYDFFYVEIFGRPVGWFVMGSYQDGIRLVDYLIPIRWIELFFMKLGDVFENIRFWIPPFLEGHLRRIEYTCDPTPLTLAVVTRDRHRDLVPVLRKGLFFTMADIDIY